MSNANNGLPTYVLKWSNGVLSASYDLVIVEYIGTTCSAIILGHNIPGFMELKDRLTHTLFCAHTCYQKGRSWHDWAVFLWEGNQTYLGRIMCFVDLTKSLHKDYDADLYAVVHSATKECNDSTHDGRMLAEVLLEPSSDDEPCFHLVTSGSIASSAFVVPNLGGKNGSFLHLCPCQDWHKLFIL